jgi:hypothetical protein
MVSSNAGPVAGGDVVQIIFAVKVPMPGHGEARLQHTLVANPWQSAMFRQLTLMD